MYQHSDFNKLFYTLKGREDLMNIYKNLKVSDDKGGVFKLTKDKDVLVDSFELSLDAFINFYSNKPPKMISRYYRVFLMRVIKRVIDSGVYSKPLSGRDILLFQMYHKRIDLGENEALRINDIVSFNEFVRLYDDFFEEIINNSEFKNESLGGKLNLVTGIIEMFYNDFRDKDNLPDIEECLDEFKSIIKNT